MNCRRARQLLFDFVDGMSHEYCERSSTAIVGECGECERFAADLTKSLALIHRARWSRWTRTSTGRCAWQFIRTQSDAFANGGVRRVGAGVESSVRVERGVMFGLVLVVGAVVVREAAGPAVTPDVTTRVSRDRPVKAEPIVPRPSLGAGQKRAGLMVSRRGTLSTPSGASHGPSTRSTTEATIDSLVSADLMRMTPEERSAYIQRRSFV